MLTITPLDLKTKKRMVIPGSPILFLDTWYKSKLIELEEKYQVRLSYRMEPQDQVTLGPREAFDRLQFVLRENY